MVVVNANLSDEERLNDTNHQYSNDYCPKCCHYPEVSYLREVDCECDCHEEPYQNDMGIPKNRGWCLMFDGCCILCGHCTDEVIAEMMGCECKCHA